MDIIDIEEADEDDVECVCISIVVLVEGFQENENCFS